MPSYEYQCESCGFEDWEVRHEDKRDEPMTCPECEKPMPRTFKTTTYVRVKDQKIWKDTRTGEVSLKKRTRVLGTDIGRIDPVKLARNIEELEKKYGKAADEREKKVIEAVERRKRQSLLDKA